MCEKNKKPIHTKLLPYLLICFFIISGAVLLPPLIVKAEDIKNPATNADCEEESGVLDVDEATLYCGCNVDLLVNIDDEKSRIVHYVCPPNSKYVCSKNDYLTPLLLANGDYITTACLKKINQPCNNNSECEAQGVCKENKCTLDKGGSIVGDGALGTEARDFRDTIRTIINYALGFLGVLCVIFLIYGGVLWITSAGKSEQVKKGRETMIWAALGTIIITIAWTITSYVLRVGEIVGK